MLEYHHIVPYRKTGDNRAENLIALCPTCHRKADKGGPWSPEYVRSLQLRPRLERLTHGIDVLPGPFTVKLGHFSFREGGDILTVGGVVVLRATKEPGGLVRITGTFHDPDGEPFAEIVDNEWRVAVGRVSDVEFVAARRLTVRLGQRRIALRMEISDTSIHLQQCFFRRGDRFVKVTGNAMRTILRAVSMTGATTTLLSDSRKESVEFAPGASLKVV